MVATSRPTATSCRAVATRSRGYLSPRRERPRTALQDRRRSNRSRLRARGTEPDTPRGREAHRGRGDNRAQGPGGVAVAGDVRARPSHRGSLRFAGGRPRGQTASNRSHASSTSRSILWNRAGYLALLVRPRRSPRSERCRSHVLDRLQLQDSRAGPGVAPPDRHQAVAPVNTSRS